MNLRKYIAELKRRNVFKASIAYLIVAWIIAEAASVVLPTFNAPAYFMKALLIILFIGFPINLVFSWIYDITREGIQKTEDIDQKAQKSKLTGNRLNKIIIASLSVAVVLLLFNQFRNMQGNIAETVESSEVVEEADVVEKSVAVLPFINDSPNEENLYFINGTMDEILNNLRKIEDLRVPGRTSVEQYRNSTKSIPEIARELDVNYIVEGSGQKYGSTFKLTVRLIETSTDERLWANSFEEEISEPEDIFEIQSQIAESIAAELKAIITPEEKQLIVKTPTANLTAYDFFQRGREEHLKFQLDINNRKALERAEDLYYKALEYDSTFAQVYTGLALIDFNKHYPNILYSGIFSDIYFKEEFLDSILILADIALSYDNQLAEAYTVKGRYYLEKGFTEQAVEEFDNAIKFNPNDWMAYNGKGHVYRFNDLIKTIDNFQKAASLNRGSELPGLLVEIGWAYFCAGFIGKNNYYLQKALELDDDSASYYYSLASCEYWLGNFEKAIEFGEKAFAIGSTHTSNLNILGESYMQLGQHEESLKYFNKWVEELKALGTLPINNMHRIGYVYWLNGYKEKANHYFNEQINFCNRSNEMGRLYAKLSWTFYDLAGVYAFRGEKDKAFENLRVFNQKKQLAIWWVTHFKLDPLFDSIRNEPEFQQIVRDVEAKYQAEHERVRKWLEENDML